MDDTMRALRWHAPLDLRIEDVPVPTPGPEDVLVRVDRTGICGTDLEAYLEGSVGIPVGEPHPLSGGCAPLVLGHEIVGTVVETVAGGPAVGTRVYPDTMVGCGECWWCVRHQETLCPLLAATGLQADGGLAEYVAARARTCVPIPDDVPTDVAAFAEPVSVAARAIAKVGDLVGSTVVVIGAGVIGQLVAQIALGAGTVGVLAIDPVATRRELAESFGATACTPDDAAAAVAELTAGRGGDVVLECSGTRGAVRTTCELTRPGGTAVLVGFRDDDEAFPLLPFVLGERRLLGTAGHCWDTDGAAAVALLARGAVRTEPLLSATVPLEQAVTDGFERIRTDRTAFKILVAPG